MLLGELNIQYLMVGYSWSGVIFETCPIPFSMHITAAFLGLGSLLVCLIVKFTPFRYTEKLPEIQEKLTEE